MTEFRALLGSVRAVQRKALANAFLFHWNKFLAWGLAGSLVAAALLPLSFVVITAAALAAIATVASFAVTWVSRPSLYDSACRLDEAAGLQDRLSTALHFAKTDVPDEMILRQRHDALGRVAEADPNALFAFRLPATSGRTLVLAIAATGLLLYRISHRPPLLVVSEKIAESRLARTLLTARPPRVESRENLALADQREAVDGDEKAGLELGADVRRERGNPLGEQDATSVLGEKTSRDEGEAGAAADPTGSEQGLRTGDETGESQGTDQQNADTQAQAAPASSLVQKLRQTLKDLLARATGQTPSEPSTNNGSPSSPLDNETPSNQDAQQRPGAANQGAQSTESDEQNERDQAQSNGSGPQDASQKGEGSAPGNSPGTQELSRNPVLETSPRPEVVPLAETDFKGEALVITSSRRGAALVPLGDTPARPDATTNGAEQGTVPLRYRAHVQQYFSQPNGKDPAKDQQ